MKELFLICALSLAPANFPTSYDDGGGKNSPTRDAFIREYEWIRDVVESQYPGEDWMIIHNDWSETPDGWTWVPFGWDGHLIYRRPKLQEAA